MSETTFHITERFRPGDQNARRERLREIIDAYLRGKLAPGSGPTPHKKVEMIS